MAALTEDKNQIYEGKSTNDLPIAAATTIWEGAGVGRNSSGYARGLVAGDQFLGFAVTRADNSAGTDGAKDVQVYDEGIIKATISGVTVADVSKDVYMSDDGTFTLTPDGNSYVGRVYRKEPEADTAMVEFFVKAPDKNAIFTTTVADISDAANVTYTAAQMIGGLIRRDPSGAARSDTSATAAQIVTALGNVAVGDSFRFSIRDLAAQTVTLLTAAGITLDGTMTVAGNNMREFLAVVTNIGTGTEAVTIYSGLSGTY
jgi:hypothetical protein